jgi:protein phosphatase
MTMEPALELPAVEYAERSDPGRDPAKQVNEDACGHREAPFGHLCVVCDGMGGHAAGREAAELALATIFAAFEQADPAEAPGTVLRAAIEQASRRVFAMPTDEVAMGRPGSTVVAVLMHARGTEVAHVGDSRGYLIHEGQIYRVTRDHSIVQEMVDRGLLTLQQAAHHPDANRITRALGMAPEVEAELRPQPVHHVTGDAFVLCSDGLSDLVEDGEILAIVEGTPAAQAVGKLVDLANARGGHDNITAIVLRARTSAIVREGIGQGQSAGIAPTLVQTGVPTGVTQVHGGPLAGALAGPPTGALTGATVPEPPRERATEVPLRDAPLEPTIPPPASPGARGRVAPAPALVGGLVLAFLAAALLATTLASHFADRAGTHNATSESATALLPSLAGPEAGAGEGGRPLGAPTTLVPDSVELPPAGVAPGQGIAPLEPVPSEPLPHGRKKK